MLVTNLKTYENIDDISDDDLSNILTLKFDANIRLCNKLVDKIKKMINLHTIDLSKNKYYYRKDYYDYAKIIDDYKIIKKYNIFTKKCKLLYKEILNDSDGLNLDYEYDLIPQLEYYMDKDLFNSFYWTLYELPIKNIYFEYVNDFIYNFTNLEIIHIKYNQFVVFNSITDICKIISNNKNLVEFVIDDSTKLYFNDFVYAIQVSRDNAIEYLDELHRDTINYLCDEQDSCYNFSCKNCVDDMIKNQTSLYLEIMMKESSFRCDIYSYLVKKFKKTKIILNSLLSKKIRKIEIYNMVKYRRLQKINLLDMYSFNNKVLTIYNSKYLNFEELNNISKPLEELHLNEIKEKLTNLPITLKKISISIKSKKYIEQSKIPFGCIIEYN